jgi:hypothetical protein
LLQSPLPGGTAYSGVVSDGEHVYFASVTALYRVPVTGGAAETVFSGPFGGPYGGTFAAIPGAVVWVTLSAAENPTGLTVSNASGLHQVALPSGVVPAWGNILMDAAGDVFFEVSLPSSTATHTWKWTAATGVAAEGSGIGMPAAGGGTNLYWADHGQVVWANNLASPAGGLYVTEIATGTAVQVVGEATQGFGSLVGLDASNIYGAGSICPMGACTFTVSGVSRAGGPPFVAFQATQGYWTNGLRADASGVYWIDWVTRSIYHAPFAQGGQGQAEVMVKLTGSSTPAQLELDACNVYWLQTDPSGAPHVMALPK